MTFAMGGAPAPGSDRIPVELFQILKDDAVESAALNMQYAICNMHSICNMPAPGKFPREFSSLNGASRIERISSVCFGTNSWGK